MSLVTRLAHQVSWNRSRSAVGLSASISLFRRPVREQKWVATVAPLRCSSSESADTGTDDVMRLSKLISQHSSNFGISRRQAERLIREQEVTVAGETITAPHYLVSLRDAFGAIKIGGKLVDLKKDPDDSIRTRVWLVHKLQGEVVTEMDPHGRPSMIDRLRRGGVGSKDEHLKAIGRLDMSTEGLIIVTNDGRYKRELEVPSNKVHRVYRARVHGKLTPYKMKALRRGLKIGNIQYRGMNVQLEATRRRPSTNSWLRITCSEGKNRQIRKMFNHLGLNVTRLIRISYGDYKLDTIPPGMALQVPVKTLSSQKRVGVLKNDNEKEHVENVDPNVGSATVTWVTST